MSSPVRGVVLAVAATLIALTAHLVASGGGSPHVGSALPVALLVGGVATRLADRCANPVPMTALLGAAQLAIHMLLTVSARDHHTAPDAPSDSGDMIAAHAVAVVVTALLLSHADALLTRLRTAVLAFLPRVVAVPEPVGPPVVVFPRRPRAVHAHLVRLVHVSPRRGPPGTR
jgi:hypothetical protein